MQKLLEHRMAFATVVLAKRAAIKETKRALQGQGLHPARMSMKEIKVQAEAHLRASGASPG